MNNLLWSILANRMYSLGETYAVASAFILSQVAPGDAAAVTSELAAAESAVTAVAGDPPVDRTASWYVQNSPFAGPNWTIPGPAGLPDQAGKAGDVLLTTGLGQAWGTASAASFPSMTGNSGKFLTNDGTVTASWAAITAGGLLPAQATHGGQFLTTDGTSTLSWAAAGGGVDTMAAVGSTPTANAASIAGTTLTMQPADATHPGVVTSASQTFGGDKTFGTGGVSIIATGGFGGPSVAWATGDFMASTGGVMYIYCNGSFYVKIAAALHFQVADTGLDMSALNVGAYIKLRSPNGTVYTATIADGGTWSIT